eukprot:1892169-Pleurochrysis_carterae.AAC.1
MECNYFLRAATDACAELLFEVGGSAHHHSHNRRVEIGREERGEEKGWGEGRSRRGEPFSA